MRRAPPVMRDYAETRRTYRLEVPAWFNYARDVVDGWARRAPGHVALVAVADDGMSTRRFTFADVSRWSNRVANFLAAQGVEKGDRVLVMVPRVPEWHAVLLGCFKLGAVPMPATPQLTPRDIAYRLERSDARAAVTDLEGAQKVEAGNGGTALKSLVCLDGAPTGWASLSDGVAEASAAPPDAEPTRASDPMVIYFTSGTTGPPKMVLHSHASFGIGQDSTARFWMDLRPRDLHWTITDTGWAKAAGGMLFGQWRVGSTIFLWNWRGKPDPERILRVAQDHAVTTFCAPPTLYRSFAQLDVRSYDWSRMRHAVAAGEPLEPETIAAWKDATGLVIHDGYGQSETTVLVANYRCMQVRPGSMGLPTPGLEIDIVDDEGTPAAAGEEGQIAVRMRPDRPVGVFLEYWQDPKLTAEVFRGDHYLTGDRARADEDGYIWFVGRADDVIISSGHRIGPFEVESALLEHPAVAESGVVGKPDPLRGQIVAAYVVLAPGHRPSAAMASELQEHVRRTTAPYRYPRAVEFVDELPKTIAGKVRRAALRERARRTDA